MKRILGLIIGSVGWLLSPLCWINDLILNIPIAFFLATPFNSFSKDVYSIAVIAGYWLTNILGFILMRLGASMSLKKVSISKKAMLIDLGTCLIFTIILVILLQLDAITALKM